MRRSAVIFRFLPVLILPLLGVFLAALLTVAQDETTNVLVYDLWAEPGTASGDTRAYLTIENEGTTGTTLVSATSTVANTVSIFTDHSEGELAVAPGEDGDLTPGGAYLLLQGLHEDFAVGDAIPLTLTFTMDGSDTPLNLPAAAQVTDTPPAESQIVVANAWARPTALEHTEGEDASSESGGAYLTIVNHGDQPDSLVAITADIASLPMMHQTVIDANNVAQMPMITQVDIPAQGMVEFEPGSFHLMLLGLSQQLVPGDTFTLTLQFASGDTLTVAVPVIDESAE